MAVCGALTVTIAVFYAAAAGAACAHSRAPCSAVARVQADVWAGSADSESRRRAIFNARSGTHLHTQIAALKTKWNEIKVEAMIDD